MKTTLVALVLFSALSSFAQSSLTIPNSFRVDRQGQIYRGREPKKRLSELTQIGITDILIFKNEIKTEVQTEIAAAKALGLRTYHIPFKWKDLESYQVACGQVIDALNIIYQTKAAGRSIYFHCTAGEDRTGLLAGLYRMLEERLSANQVFATEMCARGYSDGNPNKPGMVHGAIQRELTPLFIALAAKIQDGTIQLNRLNKSVCRTIAPVPTKAKCRN